MKSIILIGDSIRMGYQATVCARLNGLAEVYAPEDNGGTSANILAHLDEWVIGRQPDVVHINCGLHDIKREFGQDVCAVPLAAYRRNVRSILTRLQGETEAVLIWALTTCVNQEWHHENKSFDRFADDVVAYNAAATEVCRELGIIINDLYAVVVTAGPDYILSEDGVHFKCEGDVLLGERVAECLRKTAGPA